jgi:hypothetical protein
VKKAPASKPGFLYCSSVVNVRVGSKADATLLNFDVRFTPNSGHSTVQSSCPFPQSGHREFYSVPRGRMAALSLSTTFRLTFATPRL